MNPTKPKKQSARSNPVVKPETSYFPSYIHPAQFTQQIVTNQQHQVIQTSQVIQNPSAV